MTENEFDLVIPDFELPDLDLENSNEEEEVVNEKDTSQETVESEKEAVVDSDPKAIAFYEELKTRGYVSEENEFKGSWEELDAYFDTLPQQVLNSVIESLPNESKDILKFIATAGQNITKDELKSFFETYFEEQNEKSFNIETNDDARDFLMQHYKSLGTREKAINIILDNLEEDDEIIEEAKKIFEEKNKESKTEKLIVKKEEENQELKRQYQERVQSINNELQQTGWKKEKIERVSNLLSNQNLNTRLTEAFKNPKAIVQLADFLDMYNEKTKEFDLTSYKNQTLSTVTKTLKERLEKESFSSASLNTKHRNTDPNKDFEDDLVPVI
jgi:hypothetical protein